jgi:hypothetical protein
MARKRRRPHQDAVGGLAGVLIEIGVLVTLALAALLIAVIVTWIL